jgi:hypothetical protein
LAAALGEDLWVVARDVERLKPLVTALISKLGLKGLMWTRRSGSCGGRVT